MASQAQVRQQARRVALDARARMRARQAERDRRCGALAVAVVTALAERDAMVRRYEQRAGAALLALTEEEGLTLGEAIGWCGGTLQLTLREATRLRHLAAAASGAGDAPANDNAGASAGEAATAGGGRG